MTTPVQNPWKWSDEHKDYYRTEWRIDERGVGSWNYIWSKAPIATNTNPRYPSAQVVSVPSVSRGGGQSARGAGRGAIGEEQPIEPYGVELAPPMHYTHARRPSSNVRDVTKDLSGFRISGQSQQQGPYASQAQSTRPSTFAGYPVPSYPGSWQPSSLQASSIPYRSIPSHNPGHLDPGSSSARQQAATINLTDDGQADVFIGGTAGSYEPLDSTYRVIESKQERAFFRRGRVFQLLLIENASETCGAAKHLGSLVEYPGEKVFRRISRFIIVEPKCDRHYSKCIPISTYGNKATIGKSNAVQREHGIVYTGPSPPANLSGEDALHKDPVKIKLEDPALSLSEESRVNYAFTRPIQHNVKVKNVGSIEQKDLHKVLGYWRGHR